jgi:hypothetical protein
VYFLRKRLLRAGTRGCQDRSVTCSCSLLNANGLVSGISIAEVAKNSMVA